MKQKSNKSQRLRITLEAAKIMTEEAVPDYYTAKQKAADRLGIKTRQLPSNQEVENAIKEHLRLFGNDRHKQHLLKLRKTALQAMLFFKSHQPMLTGAVLSGTANMASSIQIHLQADHPDIIALQLIDHKIPYQSLDKYMHNMRDEKIAYPCYKFFFDDCAIELIIFQTYNNHDTPKDSCNNKPITRANINIVQTLTENPIASLNNENENNEIS